MIGVDGEIGLLEGMMGCHCNYGCLVAVFVKQTNKWCCKTRVLGGFLSLPTHCICIRWHWSVPNGEIRVSVARLKLHHSFALLSPFQAAPTDGGAFLAFSALLILV